MGMLALNLSLAHAHVQQDHVIFGECENLIIEAMDSFDRPIV